MEKEDYFVWIIFFMLGVLGMCFLFALSLTDREIVNHTTLDAICKDKIPNTEFKKIDDKGNIVCKELPEMQRLDHTNSYIYIDNEK